MMPQETERPKRRANSSWKLSPHSWFSSPQGQRRAIWAGMLRLEPFSEGLRDRIWWGAATNATAEWAAKLGMNLQSSTLKFDESGKPLHIQQAEQIRAFRAAWKEAGVNDLRAVHIDGFASALEQRGMGAIHRHISVGKIVNTLRAIEADRPDRIAPDLHERLRYTLATSAGRSTPRDAYSPFVARALRDAARTDVEAMFRRLGADDRTDEGDPVCPWPDSRDS